MKQPFNRLVAFELFMTGHSFDQISQVMGVKPMDIAKAIGEIGDLNWRMFRGGVQ